MFRTLVELLDPITISIHRRLDLTLLQFLQFAFGDRGQTGDCGRPLSLQHLCLSLQSMKLDLQVSQPEEEGIAFTGLTASRNETGEARGSGESRGDGDQALLGLVLLGCVEGPRLKNELDIRGQLSQLSQMLKRTVISNQLSLGASQLEDKNEKTHKFAEGRNVAEHADIPGGLRLRPHIPPLSVYQLPLVQLMPADSPTDTPAGKEEEDVKEEE
ncbi:hypothetical protein FQN60_007135 [Etheostoma spectabile]|uniref:Uncharacterized protein n=1 Tax=Etheostoma spectabile TaxID=54343 RepID=A0A5J5C6I8_9PERO|nr:hypothetical protein FQN60_007135 [Etheostoma spectabile]